MRLLYPSGEVNEDALSSEFDFWKNHFFGSALLASAGAVSMGLNILLWPAGSGSAELRSFMRQLWPAFVECGFWLGFLVGLLWAASRRIGCALVGTVPWSPPDANRFRAVARLFGQAGFTTASGSVLLWVAIYFVDQLGSASPALMTTLMQLVHTGCASAALFLLVALVLGLGARIRQ